jgi:hypothetical protein
MEVDPLDPPWAPPLARAAIKALLGGSGDVDDTVATLGLLTERCADSRAWDLAVHVAARTAQQQPAGAARVAVALLSPTLPRVRESTRAQAAEEACAAATDRHACCVDVTARLTALGRLPAGACGAPKTPSTP